MDLNKDILDKAAKAKAANSGFLSDMVGRVVAAGQSIVSARANVRTASAPERKTPFSSNQIESVGRVDQGAGGPRDLHKVVAQDKDRQLSNVVARARDMIEKKLSAMPINGPDILYMKADISRWDDHTGQPQTGRISFQIPFHGPQGDPRTIYSSVDLVMGGLMEPKNFTDGMNNVYAMDKTGLTELFKGESFDVVHQPKVAPQTKYTGPEFHAPDGQPGAVAAVNSPLMFRKSSTEITRVASGEKPSIAREGLVRSLSKEAAQIARPVTPAEVAKLKAAPAARQPAAAGTAFTLGTSAEDNRTDPHGNATQGGQTDPVLASAELREVSHDGKIVSTAKGEQKALIDQANAMTFGGHDHVVEVWAGDKMVYRVAKSKDQVRLASSGLSKAVADLKLMDVRMVCFHDLILLCKQHGKDGDLSFDSAAKELAKAGIVLFKSAQTDGRLLRRLAHARRLTLAGPESPVIDAPSSPAVANMPEVAPGAEAGTGAAGTPEIAPPSGLDPVEFREFQGLMDQYNNEWETVHQRETNNIKNGNAPHMGIDYTNLQLIYDKIEAYQQRSKAGEAEAQGAAPSDLAEQPKTTPSAAAPANPSGEQSGTGTLAPEKGKGLAGQAPRMERSAIEQAKDMKSKGEEITEDMVEKKATLTVDPELQSKITENGGNPDNIQDPKTQQVLELYDKTAARSPKFPEVCKNCKSLVVPTGYSPLKEFQHTRMPFCGAPKKAGVGFIAAYFRDCLGYDPIVKEIPQKIESVAPESEQTEADTHKGMKEKKASSTPSKVGEPCQLCGDNMLKMSPGGIACPVCESEQFKLPPNAKAKTAASLPSPDPEAVSKKDSPTGYALDIREWCEKAGHYAPAGEVHPTHDWCTLWNTAVENLVKLPGGAVVPKSMSGMSSEPNGEGGPHQFGNTPNQTI